MIEENLQDEILDKFTPIVEYNFHTHTKRCGHATGEDRSYIESAIKNGYKVLGISDHCPYLGISLPNERMEWEEFSQYLNSIKNFKEEYKDKIDIYVGLECEYFDKHLEQLKILKKDVDYLILGQHHYLDGVKTKPYLSEEKMFEMVDEIRKAAATGLFLYIAHPDYFWRERKIWDDVAIEISHEICKISVEYDIPIELNQRHILFIKQEEPDVYLGCLSFWKIAKEYNCKVCFGIDAHDPQNFSEQIDEMFLLNDILKFNVISTEELLDRIERI